MFNENQLVSKYNFIQINKYISHHKTTMISNEFVWFVNVSWFLGFFFVNLIYLFFMFLNHHI